MIFPGSASRKAEVSRDWCAARNASTPRASAGSIHSVCVAVMTASRPNCFWIGIDP